MRPDPANLLVESRSTAAHSVVAHFVAAHPEVVRFVVEVMLLLALHLRALLL